MELTKASHFPKDKRNSPGVLCLSGVSNGILKMTLFFLIHGDFFKGKKARKMIGSDRHCLGKKKKNSSFSSNNYPYEGTMSLFAQYP